MFLFNLDGLLKQKRLTIIDLSRLTGISRPVLTGIYHNSKKNVTLDTINKVCKALNTAPESLMSYYQCELKRVDGSLHGGYSSTFVVEVYLTLHPDIDRCLSVSGSTPEESFFKVYKQGFEFTQDSLQIIDNFTEEVISEMDFHGSPELLKDFLFRQIMDFLEQRLSEY